MPRMKFHWLERWGLRQMGKKIWITYDFTRNLFKGLIAPLWSMMMALGLDPSDSLTTGHNDAALLLILLETYCTYTQCLGEIVSMEMYRKFL